MNSFRIALANLRFPSTREESVELVVDAIGRASAAEAKLVAFPECFVPGYRDESKRVLPPDPVFLEHAWKQIAEACAKASVIAVVGTERINDGALLACVLVVAANGTIVGFQDKVQIDPSEEGRYAAAVGRRIFRVGHLTFGVVICHEGWRYPETVRWAAQRGAQLVVHPVFAEAEPGAYVPSTFADPANTFHEKAVLCRAAENTCYFATVNFASPGAPITSAIARPDGTLLAYQPYGQDGLLIADLDLDLATGLLASRCKADSYGAG